MKKPTWIRSTVLALLFAAAGSAQAAVTVICPNTLTITTDREHELTTEQASTCLAYGNGNLQGAIGKESDDFFTSGVGSAYTILDKDVGDALAGIENLFSISGVGDKTATFTIDASLWSLYSSLAVGFTAGDGQIDNRWAVFGLATDTLTGSWTSSPDRAGGLSHAVLYGIKKTQEVPEPVSLALLGVGLLGVAATRRQRSRKA